MEIKRPASIGAIPNDAQKVFTGTIFDVYQWNQEQYDGSFATFEKLTRPDTVVIIPCLPNGKILIEEEEQPGRAKIRTAPAGRMEPGEAPLEAAKRELLEETGHSSEEWILFKAYQPVMKIDWAIYVFVARNCKKTHDQNLDPGERISLTELTLDEFIQAENELGFGTPELVRELVAARYNTEQRALLEKALFG